MSNFKRSVKVQMAFKWTRGRGGLCSVLRSANLSPEAVEACEGTLWEDCTAMVGKLMLVARCSLGRH